MPTKPELVLLAGGTPRTGASFDSALFDTDLARGLALDLFHEAGSAYTGTFTVQVRTSGYSPVAIFTALTLTAGSGAALVLYPGIPSQKPASTPQLENNVIPSKRALVRVLHSDAAVAASYSLRATLLP